MVYDLENENEQEFMLTLYREHYDIVRRKIRSITGDVADLEDICQECFIRLIKKKSRLCAMSCNILTGYVVITARNTALDYLKDHHKQTGHLFYGLEDDLAPGMPDPAPGADAALVLALVIVFSALVMNVEAVRQQVMKTLFVDKRGGYTHVSVFDVWPVLEANPNHEFGMHYLPTYLPEGFTIDEAMYSSDNMPGMIIYSNPEAPYPKAPRLMIIECDLSSGINIGSGYQREEFIYIWGREALLAEKDGSFSIILPLDELIITVSAEDISEEETLKIVSSLRPVE